MNFRRMMTKTLSVLLSVVMLLGVCAPLVSAIDSDHDHGALGEINYVSIGDSMTNGYGFEGYYQNSDDRNYYDIMTGKGMYGEGAYPLQFEQYLKDKGFDVNHTKLATSAMTAEDFLYLLGGRDFAEDGWNGYKDYVGTYTDEELMVYFQKAVKNADIITLCIGNASFGAYLVDAISRIMGVFGAEYPESWHVTLDDALALVESEELKEMVFDIYEDLKAEILPYISVIGEEKANFFVNQIAYTVASFLVNYDLVLDKIMEMNPDVDIILVGLFNTMEGFTLTGEDFNIPFGEWMTNVYGVLNTYIAGVPALKKASGEEAYANADFYYAEQPKPQYIFEAFDDLAAAGWENVDGGRLSADTVRSRTIETYMNSIAPMIASGFGMPYDWMKITLDDVKAFEANEKNDWAHIDSWGAIDPKLSAVDALIDMAGLTKPGAVFMPNAQNLKKLSTIIYLAIEKGIIGSADTKEIPLADLLLLTEENGLQGVFDGIDVSSLYGMDPNVFNYGLFGTLGAAAGAYQANPTPETGAALVAAVNAVNTAVESTRSAMELEKIQTYFADYFTDDSLKALCKIFALFKIGNGMSVHPTPSGHDNIAASVIKAYDEKHTVFAETVKNLHIIGGFIAENYEEVYALVYDEAFKLGLITDLNNAVDARLDKVLASVDAAEAWANEYKDYFRGEDFAAQIALCASDIRVTVEALRTLIKNADRLDEETKANALVLVEALKSNLASLTELVNIAAEDAAEYVKLQAENAKEQIEAAKAEAEKAIAELKKELAILNAKVIETLESLDWLDDEIKACVEKVSAIVEGLFAKGEAYVKEFLSHDAFRTDYVVSADSFYLAIGNDTLYAELLADKLGLGADQFAAMNRADIDSSIIAKADLITVGFEDELMNRFVIDQLFGYVKNYIDVDLRASANAYAEEAIKHFFSQIVPTPNDELIDSFLGSVTETLDQAVDGVLTYELIADAKIEAMDWAALVGEENLPYIETVLASMKVALAKAGVPEAYFYEIPVLDFFMENLDQFGPAVSGTLKYFDEASIREMFGDYATYTVEIPVADTVAFAVESYLYNYVKFNVEYAKLVFAINAINPDAKVVLLGGYNAFDGLGFDLTIGDIVINFSDIFTEDVKDTANSFIDDIYSNVFGTLDSVLDSNKVDVIEKTLACLEAEIANVFAEAKKAQADMKEFDVAAAIKAIEIPEVTLAALVGEENVGYAKRLINIVKFALTEADVYEAVLAEFPETAEIRDLLIEVTLDLQAELGKLDDLVASGEAGVKDLFAELNLTLPMLRAILDDLASYVDMIEKNCVDFQTLLNGIYDSIAAHKIVINGRTVDLGELLCGAVSDSASVHALAYALSMENVIFVNAPEVETVYEAAVAAGLYEGTVEEFLMAYIFDGSITGASEDGHAYIAEQIYNALNVVCAHNDVDGDHVCDYCGATVSDCADANDDGVCDICSACVDHRYDNACDADCNNCGATRTPAAHVYDNACDADCNVCGATRTPAAHVYDNACDADCNVCSATRTVADHVYDNACDASCNVCGATRTVADHVYDNACDADCNVCGATRTPADHVYDNSCDTSCNVCGATRTDIEHVYDNACDASCNNCGATRTPADHVFGEWVTTKEATKKEAGEKQRTCSVCGAAETEVIPQLKGLSTGAVVAIVSGSAVVAAGAGVAGYFLFIKKRIGGKDINAA